MYVWTDGTDYLAHHGTKGMKWGVRNYQNPDGTLTALGRARLGLKGTYDGARHAIKNAKAAIKQARMKAKRASSLRKARKAKEAKAKEAAAEAARKKAEEEAIERAVASGDPSEIRKYADKMTTQQLRDANTRIDTMKALDDREKASQVSKSDIAFSKLSDLTAKADTGIKFYNRVAALSNTFLGTDLRQIDATLGSEARAKAEKARLDLENAYLDNAKKQQELRKTGAEASKTEAETRRANEKHIEDMKQERAETSKKQTSAEQDAYNLERQKESQARKDRESAEDRSLKLEREAEDRRISLDRAAEDRRRAQAQENEERRWAREDRDRQKAIEDENREWVREDRDIRKTNDMIDTSIRRRNAAEDRRRAQEREDKLYERISNAARGSSWSPSDNLISKTLSGRNAAQSKMDQKVSDALGYSSSRRKEAENFIMTAWGPVPIDDKYAKIYDSYNKYRGNG